MERRAGGEPPDRVGRETRPCPPYGRILRTVLRTALSRDFAVKSHEPRLAMSVARS